MPRGGRRPGAGRKPGGTSKAGPGRTPKRNVAPGPVRAAEDKIRDRLPELVDVALDLAIKDRNERMIIYCIDRVLGKPTQPVDVYDAARSLARQRGLDPDKVVSIYDRLKKSRAV